MDKKSVLRVNSILFVFRIGYNLAKLKPCTSVASKRMKTKQNRDWRDCLSKVSRSRCAIAGGIKKSGGSVSVLILAWTCH